MRILNTLLVALLGMGWSLAGFAENDSDWAFSIEPYLLVTSIEGDAGLGRAGDVPVDVDFSTILDNLDMGFMGHFEAFKNNRWGFALDYGFMDLGASVPVALNGVLEADVRQGVLEALVVRRLDKGENSLDIFAGLRWWDNDIGATLDLAITPGSRSVEVKQDWIDAVIGVRWHHPMSDRWKLVLRGDVGGFGLESDFTATTVISAFRKFNSVSMELAYRATWVNFETGTTGMPGYFAYDTVTHGPIIGVVFEF
jgi:hypothetical protein